MNPGEIRMTETDHAGKLKETTTLRRRTSRRSLLRAAAVAGVGAFYVAFVGLNPLAGLARTAFAEPPAGPTSLRCRPCGASVETRAGYVICQACEGETCPHCARLGEQGFFCRTCFRQV